MLLEGKLTLTECKIASGTKKHMCAIIKRIYGRYHRVGRIAIRDIILHPFHGQPGWEGVLDDWILHSKVEDWADLKE